MDEATEVSFQALINPFSVSIGLWMVGTTHVQFSARQTKESLPQLTSEYAIPVSDNGQRHTM